MVYRERAHALGLIFSIGYFILLQSLHLFFFNDIRWYIEERTLSPREERCRSGVDPGQLKIKGKKQPLKDHLYTCAHTHKNTSIKLSDSHVFSSYRLYISFFTE